MANIVRLDIVEGKPRVFVAPADVENGYFLEIKGKAPNAELGATVDYEAYKVALATATTKRGNLLFHCSVENMYDERLMKQDFVLKKDQIGRGYQLVAGDIVTIPAEMVGATVNSGVVSGIAVGDEVKLAAAGKLAKDTAGTDAIGVVEAIEDLTIPEADPQASVVIRFY